MKAYSPISIIGVKYGAAGKVNGAENGVEILTECLKRTARFVDGGNVLASNSTDEKLRQVIKVSNNTRERSKEALERGLLPFVIGGDHSTVFGNIAASCERFGPDRFGVVYLDAHCDINTPETSPTGNLHGMHLAALMGYGDDAWCCVAPKKVIPSHILFVGARSIDPGEKALIHQRDIPVISSNQIHNSCFEKTQSRIDRFIKDNSIDHLHFSIDIDVLDPQFVPGTGVPEKEGLYPEEFFRIVQYVSQLPILCSMDIVEFIPSLDKDDKTKNLCLETIRIATHL